MDMLNPHCGIDRDSRGVVRLTICNAGKLNIVSSAVTNGVREGFEHLAADHSIRAVILRGRAEVSGACHRPPARLVPRWRARGRGRLRRPRRGA